MDRPEQLKQWWKSVGKALKEASVDLKEGGTVSYTFYHDTLTIAGQCEEVKQNEKLVYTWNW